MVNMDNFNAERKLLFSIKGEDTRKVMVVCIGAPYIVDENTVNFPVGKGLVGCHVEVKGLPNKYSHEVYGMDGIQALEIATDIEPLLKRLSKKYNLYWSCGDPYW